MPKKHISPRRWEPVALLAALLALAGWFLVSNRTGAHGVAHLSVDGAEILTLDLAAAPDETIDLRLHGVPGLLEIRGGRARFRDVSCPDHICEQTGWVWRDGQSAVCVPNRAALVVVK